MTTTLLVIGFVVSVIFNIIFGIGLKRSLQKIESFEDRIITTDILLRRMLNDMREIDDRGIFEKDDEVGSVFEQLKILIKFYTNLIIPNNAKKEEEEQ